jgi:DNA-binding MarR family transcriptional regulator
LGADRSTLIDDLIAGIDDNLLVRARLLSKAVTGIYDDKLRPFGISSAQFTLLVVIGQTEPTTRAEIARHQHLDKSTLTRNLKTILSEGWVQEVRETADGRSKPLALTAAGKELLINAQPAWLAAQAEAKALLGKDGMTAVIRTADRILNPSDVSTSVAGTEHESDDPGTEYESDDPAIEHECDHA